MSNPKLSERAMLSALHISSYSGMMTDREVTEEINESYKADRKTAGRYNKKLINPKYFTEVSAAHNAAKRVHKLLTLPWEDGGTRILTTAGYMAYTSKMKECRLKVEGTVKEFVNGLPEYIAEAKTRLGGMFDVADYPDAAALEAKFGFDVEIKPLPESSDFRAKLSDDQMKHVLKDFERRSNDRLHKAVNDMFERVAEVVQNMSKRLKEYVPPANGNKREGIIRDSLVYNIHELAEMLPMLNVTNDKRIDALAKQLRDDLVEHSPEILRADAKVRKETISKADAILKKVEAYMK